jgi:hypothetical protein
MVPVAVCVLPCFVIWDAVTLMLLVCISDVPRIVDLPLCFFRFLHHYHHLLLLASFFSSSSTYSSSSSPFLPSF